MERIGAKKTIIHYYREVKIFPFLAMLTSGLRETDQEEPIEIQGVDAGAGELLIQYIYTGEILLDHQVGFIVELSSNCHHPLIPPPPLTRWLSTFYMLRTCLLCLKQ